MKKTCPHCGTTFSVLPCRAARKFCSKLCLQTAGRVQGKFPVRACEACQIEFEPRAAAQRCCKVCVPTHEAGTRWRLFRLTQAAFEAMFVSQDHACKICRVPFAQLPKSQIHLDHDHETNRARGILCQRCNTFVGVVEANKRFLPTVLEYIDEFRC